MVVAIWERSNPFFLENSDAYQTKLHRRSVKSSDSDGSSLDMRQREYSREGVSDAQMLTDSTDYAQYHAMFLPGNFSVAGSITLRCHGQNA